MPDASQDAAGMAVVQEAAAQGVNAEAADFWGLLEARTGQKYAFAKDRFLLAPPPGQEVVACSALLDPATLEGIIDRFAAGFGDVDRRAVISLWTMYYFSVLTIGAAIAWLELRRVLPLSLDRCRVAIDPASGAPTAFILEDLGICTDSAVHQALEPVLRRHAEPLIAAIAAHGRVAPKLIWGNAASYLGWAIEEAGRVTDPALAAEGLPVMTDSHFPDGSRNPLCGAIRDMADDDGNAFKRRRVCCLRYCLPSIGGCGQSCPLPEGRAGAAA